MVIRTLNHILHLVYLVISQSVSVSAYFFLYFFTILQPVTLSMYLAYLAFIESVVFC